MNLGERWGKRREHVLSRAVGTKQRSMAARLGRHLSHLLATVISRYPTLPPAPFDQRRPQTKRRRNGGDRQPPQITSGEESMRLLAYALPKGAVVRQRLTYDLRPRRAQRGAGAR